VGREWRRRRTGAACENGQNDERGQNAGDLLRARFHLLPPSWSRRDALPFEAARALPRGANVSVQQAQALTDVFRSETSGEVKKANEKPNNGADHHRVFVTLRLQ